MAQRELTSDRLPGPPIGQSAEMPCTCARLRRTARRLTRAYDRALRPSGLRLTQYSVLANVTRAGGLSITELAERLAMDRTTLTRNLRPLEAAGWVRVAPRPRPAQPRGRGHRGGRSHI